MSSQSQKKQKVLIPKSGYIVTALAFIVMTLFSGYQLVKIGPAYFDGVFVRNKQSTTGIVVRTVSASTDFTIRRDIHKDYDTALVSYEAKNKTFTHEFAVLKPSPFKEVIVFYDEKDPSKATTEAHVLLATIAFDRYAALFLVSIVLSILLTHFTIRRIFKANQ